MTAPVMAVWLSMRMAKYEPAVADGGVGVDVFQVGLHDGGVGPVNDADAREDDEYPGEFFGGFRHEVDGDAEAAVSPEFHQYPGVEHGDGRGGGGVTVGRPGVERE